jgi:hypothetical protein
VTNKQLKDVHKRFHKDIEAEESTEDSVEEETTIY